ncbi:MAG TPA: metalloregulator ArsR/SmtB family transcription factor [Solirubrobacterales bacterium]|nr:metalloregulator ArsR/SmtB family transcription factor [Solirubrobacterales bacterium]
MISPESASPTSGSRRARLNAEAIELTAARLRVIGDPVRISLLEALNEGEGAVCDLAERVDLPHKNASHHLLALHQASILARRREGKLTLYSIADWSAWWVVDQIARSVEAATSDTH